MSLLKFHTPDGHLNVRRPRYLLSSIFSAVLLFGAGVVFVVISSLLGLLCRFVNIVLPLTSGVWINIEPPALVPFPLLPIILSQLVDFSL